ncbi:MAG: diacylglycerol/lipid kinase family protein [Anaerolineales bacterium]
MSKVMLIFNPAADRGRSGQKASDLRAIVDKMGGAEWAATEYPAHAAELAEQAGKDKFDTVVALGGDGTVHEIVNGLMKVKPKRRPNLGVVPIGSGNDFAWATGINFNLQQAMERVFNGTPAPIDIGSITDGSGRTEYWDNSCGMLIVAAINIQSRRITRIYGFAMYLLATIRGIIENYDATHVKLTVDGKTSEHDLILFTVGNGPREGGGFLTNPDAKNDDGIFNYFMSDHISRPMMFRLLPEVMQGRQEHFPFVTFGKCLQLELEADRAIPIHLDGELWAPYEADVRKLAIEIHPGALGVIR